MRITKRLPLVVAFAIVLSACGGSSTVVETPPGGSTSESSTAAPEAQMAPDFSLKLGDGDTFTLSQEVLPVYMVFWAEW